MKFTKSQEIFFKVYKIKFAKTHMHGKTLARYYRDRTIVAKKWII